MEVWEGQRQPGWGGGGAGATTLLHCLTSSGTQPQATAANGGGRLATLPLSLPLFLLHIHRDHIQDPDLMWTHEFMLSAQS